MDAAEVLKEIGQQVTACQNCILHQSRKRSVPGEGPVDSDIMFIGEGPGFHENEQGRPFVGAAGHFLEELLGKAGLQRATVFITNVVKCRPPGNRDPQPDELLACSAYLDRQIEVINPLVIVTLGRFSMARYIQDVKISAIHGKPKWVADRLIVPMFHPAAALHQPALRSSIEQDFARLPQFISQALEKRSQLAGNASPGYSAPAPTTAPLSVKDASTDLASPKPAPEAPIQPSLLPSEPKPPQQTESKEDYKQLNLF